MAQASQAEVAWQLKPAVRCRSSASPALPWSSTSRAPPLEPSLTPHLSQPWPLSLPVMKKAGAEQRLRHSLPPMRRKSVSDSRIPSYTILPLRSLTSQIPCSLLGSPPLRMSSIKKVLARDTVNRVSRPLVRDVRGAHHQRGAAPPLR